MHDDVTREKHVADMRSPEGLVLEFQHSNMPPDELRSREDFYKRVTWVVDGSGFRARFHILDPLPAPGSALAREVVVFHRRQKTHGGFWRRSENQDHDESDSTSMVQVHPFSEIKEQVLRGHGGHYSFEWVKPHSVWFGASRPVLIDFGEENLWLLEACRCGRNQCPGKSVRQFPKVALLKRFGGQAERFES